LALRFALTEGLLDFREEDKRLRSHTKPRISNWSALRNWVNEDVNSSCGVTALIRCSQDGSEPKKSSNLAARAAPNSKRKSGWTSEAQDFSDQERKFISASREERELLAREEKERQERQLEAARKLAEAQKERAEQAESAHRLEEERTKEAEKYAREPQRAPRAEAERAGEAERVQRLEAERAKET